MLLLFKYLTKLGQEKGTPLGSIASVLWGFDMLLDILEKAREKVFHGKKTGHYTICVDHAWGLMNKYYSLTDKSRVYIIATVLDLR